MIHVLLLALSGAAQQDTPRATWDAYVERRVGQPFRFEATETGTSVHPPDSWLLALPAVLGDVDGDGADDLRIAAYKSMSCGADTPFGCARDLSPRRQERLAHVGGLAHLRVSASRTGLFVHRKGRYGHSRLERRAALEG